MYTISFLVNITHELAHDITRYDFMRTGVVILFTVWTDLTWASFTFGQLLDPPVRSYRVDNTYGILVGMVKINLFAWKH